eukprot:403700-Amorphochlora_amoeboformis.AAC.1
MERLLFRCNVHTKLLGKDVGGIGDVSEGSAPSIFGLLGKRLGLGCDGDDLSIERLKAWDKILFDGLEVSCAEWTP